MKTHVLFFFALLIAVCGTKVMAQTTAGNTDVSALMRDDNMRITAVLPNPATERVRVEFNALSDGQEVYLRVKNDDGKVFLRRLLVTRKGSNMVILPIENLPAGSYVVQLEEGWRIRSARWQKM